MDKKIKNYTDHLLNFNVYTERQMNVTWYDEVCHRDHSGTKAGQPECPTTGRDLINCGKIRSTRKKKTLKTKKRKGSLIDTKDEETNLVCRGDDIL